MQIGCAAGVLDDKLMRDFRLNAPAFGDDGALPAWRSPDAIPHCRPSSVNA
jgi:hypothetical protein